MNAQSGTPEQERRRDALVRWLVMGEEPADAKECVDGFNMDALATFSGCGTVCCMAGAVNAWWGRFQDRAETERLLGISPDAAIALFCPNGLHRKTSDRLHAARVFQNWRETGVVDWDGMQ